MTTTSSQLERIAPVGEAPKRKSYLFFGPPGTGKTELATKHPGKRKLWLDADDKLTEIEGRLSPSERSRIEVWSPGVPLGNPEGVDFDMIDPTRKNVTAFFDPKRPMPEGYERQRKVTNELLHLAARNEFPYDLVVWDSVTRTNDHLVELVLWHHKMTSMTETLWGVLGRNLRNYIVAFLNLPCDVIVIAHDKHERIYDKKRETVLEEYIRPLLTGQMARYIPQSFSEVYYFLGRAGDGKYYIQTGSDRLKTARTAKPLEFEQSIMNPEAVYGNIKA